MESWSDRRRDCVGRSDPFLPLRGCARLAVCDKDLGVVPTGRTAWTRHPTTAAIVRCIRGPSRACCDAGTGLLD